MGMRVWFSMGINIQRYGYRECACGYEYVEVCERVGNVYDVTGTIITLCTYVYWYW